MAIETWQSTAAVVGCKGNAKWYATQHFQISRNTSNELLIMVATDELLVAKHFACGGMGELWKSFRRAQSAG